MPSPEAILGGLEAIANEWRSVAVAWHAAVAIALVALIAGWRPASRTAGVLLALPLASVSALAWLSGNPFNGAVFGALVLALLAVALRLPRTAPGPSAPWLVAAGVALAAFGWVYPHFLRTGAWTAYLYAAPLGIVPCPTLSLIAGATLASRGLESRAWSGTVAVAGILYGAIGLLRLRVGIDAVLLLGAVVLAGAAAAGFGGRQARLRPVH